MASGHSHWNWGKLFLLGNVFHILCISYFQNSYNTIFVNRNQSWAEWQLCKKSYAVYNNSPTLNASLFFYLFFVFGTKWVSFVSILSSFILHCIGYVKWPYSPCLPSSVTVLVRFKYNLHYTHASKKEIWDQ